MKLLLCLKCNDVFNLDVETIRECSCGHTAGMYLNEIEAVYHGERAFPLGFANGSFIEALKQERLDVSNEKEKDLGNRFEAFVIPWNSPTFDHVEDVYDYQNG